MTTEPSTEITVNRIKEITCAKCGHTVDISRAKPLSITPCPSCGADVRVPAQIGDFLLVKKIASGGSGAVYVAYDENLWRQVALKLIYKNAKGADYRNDEVAGNNPYGAGFALGGHWAINDVVGIGGRYEYAYLDNDVSGAGGLDGNLYSGTGTVDVALTKNLTWKVEAKYERGDDDLSNAYSRRNSSNSDDAVFLGTQVYYEF